jgi:hypothetical protein
MRRWHLTAILAVGAAAAAALASRTPASPAPALGPIEAAPVRALPPTPEPLLRALPPDPPARTYTSCGGVVEARSERRSVSPPRTP